MKDEPGSDPNSDITSPAPEMVEAIGLLKLLAHREDDIEMGSTIPHSDAIRRAREAISDE